MTSVISYARPVRRKCIAFEGVWTLETINYLNRCSYLQHVLVSSSAAAWVVVSNNQAPQLQLSRAFLCWFASIDQLLWFLCSFSAALSHTKHVLPQPMENRAACNLVKRCAAYSQVSANDSCPGFICSNYWGDNVSRNSTFSVSYDSMRNAFDKTHCCTLSRKSSTHCTDSQIGSIVMNS